MRLRALIATAVLLLTPRIGLAQSLGPSLDVRGFHASSDPGAGVYLEPASTPGTGDWSVSVWSAYAYRPITLRDKNTGAVAFEVISHQITSDVAASVGIGHRLSLGFELPVLLFQTGDAPTPRSRRILGDTALPAQALGDLGIDAKLTLLRPTADDFGGFALAVHERVTVPTGDQASYLGEGAVTSETRVLAEYRLANLGIYASTGFLFRGQVERFACGGFANEADCPSRFGHELPFGVGVSLNPALLGLNAFSGDNGLNERARVTLFLESYGHLPLWPVGPFQSAAASSLRASLGARVALRDVSFLVAVETALGSGVGDSPFRGILSASWAPRDHDVDNDGIEDDLDQCLDLPEDKDGYQDDDGCPDLDNDDDGVPDKFDQCPFEKEDLDGYKDDDGCPDPDNDGDGILDAADRCPNEKGVAAKKGCPDPDSNKDTEATGAAVEATPPRADPRREATTRPVPPKPPAPEAKPAPALTVPPLRARPR